MLYFRNSPTCPFMVERLGVERVQEIVADGQSAHPRRDLEIEDEGVLHLEHNLQSVICFDRPRKTSFLPCLHYGCCAECADQFNRCPFCKKDIFFVLSVLSV